MDPNESNPYLHGAYAPVSREIAADDLAVVGEIPADLRGVYVRNGPNPRVGVRGRYHWFDGDGMLHALDFADGSARYCNRWIETEHLTREREAGEPLWTGLLESTRDNPKGAPYKDTANTDVLAFRGQLLTLWYICGTPYRVDPHGLATQGPTQFGFDSALRMSAHAKVDPETGELMFFDYQFRPPFFHYSVVDAEGTLRHRVPITVAGPRLPHDMAITENYSILMDLPVHFRPEALQLKRWLVDYHRDLPARFAVLPRHGDNSSVRWFEAEPCYIYHTVNAWEEGDEIVMVGCRCVDPIPAADPRDGRWARALANLRLSATLHEWRFNLQTGQTRERQLDDDNTEFPAIDMDRLGRKTRYAYNVSIAAESTLRFDGLVKFDTATGASQRYAFGPGCYGSEAVFARRPNASDEDAGYVISFVQDTRENRSEAVILDAGHFDAGPIARVQLPQRVPAGFHACWVGESS